MTSRSRLKEMGRFWSQPATPDAAERADETRYAEYPPIGTERVCVRSWEVADLSASEVGADLAGTSYDWALVLATFNGSPTGLRYIELGPQPLVVDQLTRMVDTGSEPGTPARSSATALDDTALPSVSIVIPTTFERWAGLQRVIAGVSEQRYAPLEILVIDNRPDSGLVERRELIAGVPQVRVVPAAKRGVSAARNIGIAEARGDIIAFTDDDARPDRNWTLEIARAFVDDPQTSVVTGLNVPLELESDAQIKIERSGSVAERRFVPYFYERADLRVRRKTSKLSKWFSVRRCSDGLDDVCHSIYRTGPFGMGMNFAMKRDLVDEVGGFDENLGTGSPCHGGEDLEMIFRILWRGYRLRFQPSAYVWHAGRATTAEIQQQMRSYGIGFGAALAAFIARSPIQLLGLALVSVSWVRGVAQHRIGGAVSAPVDEFPAELQRLRSVGRLMGPAIYLKTTLRSKV